MLAQKILADSRDHPIIIYDGVCMLCNRFVNWVIRIDKHARFRFVAQQSVNGNIIGDEEDTVVLLHDGCRYTYSDVALQACRLLPQPWPLLAFFFVVPKRLRDAIYKWVARNRYRWFGKSESCLLPGPDVRYRFLGL